MDMTGERRIPAPREKVWAALNDVNVLKACIPGCESLEKTSPTDMKAIAAFKIGPIAARFTGQVGLRDLDPPNSYRIEGEGAGGVAGFAKGGATVRLAEDGAFTVLTYDVKAQVGGKIAQLGARLIDATAKQYSDMFFNRFVTELSAPPAVVEAAPAATDSPVSATMPAPVPVKPKPPAAVSLLSMIPKEPYGYPLVFWIGSALFLVIFVLLFKGYVI